MARRKRRQTYGGKRIKRIIHGWTDAEARERQKVETDPRKKKFWGVLADILAGYTYKETAERNDVSLSTVSKWIRHSKRYGPENQAVRVWDSTRRGGDIPASVYDQVIDKLKEHGGFTYADLVGEIRKLGYPASLDAVRSAVRRRMSPEERARFLRPANEVINKEDHEEMVRLVREGKHTYASLASYLRAKKGEPIKYNTVYVYLRRHGFEPGPDGYLVYRGNGSDEDE